MIRIVIVDYNMGNLASVRNAFKAVGHEVTVTADPAVVSAADGLVLPGMGAFGSGMRNLADRGLIEPIRRHAEAGRPLLGICLGMQLLFTEGEEFGHHVGLGLLSGRVTRLPGSVKLPQIGWNLVEPVRTEHPIFEGLGRPYYAYFDHTYAAEDVAAEAVAATTDYGQCFPSVVAQDNLVGIQFHPEKSSRVGLQMLANFGGIVCRSSSIQQSI